MKLFIVGNKRLLQCVLGLALLSIVIWQSNPAKLQVSLAAAPLYFIIPWLVFYYITLVLTWALGVYLLLRRVRRGSFLSILDASFRLQFLSVILPGRIGDLGLIFFLKKEYTLAQTSAAFLADKTITLIVNFALAIIGFGVIFSLGYSLISAVIFSTCFLLILWMALKCPKGWFRWRILDELISRFHGFRMELRATFSDHEGICWNLTLTVLRYFLAGLSMVLILFWFGVEVPLFKVILIQALVQLATFVPLTMMGLGVQEAMQVTLFAMIGVPSDIILAAGLWGRAIHLGFIFLLYIYWMWARPGALSGER